ncbi:MAG: efflux RND transporter permease subunit [Gammaproteobacteria bacterium]|nr:efflux RND transporter permease subunit [Gammaproteobacteria bacterium]MCP5199640.1 efflux RND transporter permease subunit [Gammaproteobacteria bacterium]
MSGRGEHRGLLALFARHPTAANLVLALMFICGLAALTQINRQFFPDFGIDMVSVTVSWPGASAADVDENIVQAVEPELRFLDGVKKVTASSYEGLAAINVEFNAGADMQQGLSDVESAVGQVRTLPEDAERPEIRRIVRYETVSRLVISGPFAEHALKVQAKRIRDELLDRGVDRIDLFGARDEEIWVEVEPAMLRQLDLKLGDIATRIAESSQDVPAGELAGGERQVRSLGLQREARGLGAIEIKAESDGRRLVLDDIARVSEAFKERDRRAIRKGDAAIELDIKRATDSDALTMARVVKDYVAELDATLPPTLRVEEYDVRAKSIRQRIQLLVANGLSGLVLVLAVLFLFLNARVALWVAVGIPASLLAGVAVMWASGQTINMISLFGMIMAIGIVVDDAIVVGEHAEHLHRNGMSALDAAIGGARRMAAPVSSSTLTTVAAFLPLFIVSGIMGQIISAIPFVVVTVLLASLLECFFVLPAHLSHALRAPPGRGRLTHLVARFDARFNHFREHRFRALAEAAVRRRYLTVAVAIAAFTISIGAVMGGRVGYQFFPSPEPDKIYANVEMVAGTSRADTRAALLDLEQALYRAAGSLVERPDDLIVMALGKLGTTVGGERASSAAANTDTLGGMVVELVSSEERAVRAQAVIDAWREAAGHPPGVESLTFTGQRTGPSGGDLDVRLRGGRVEDLKAAAGEVAALLARYDGVTDVDDDLPYGKPEVVLRVNARGRALGFTTADVARQVRDAIDGAVAKRFPRGDEEIWIRVQLAREQVGHGLLERVYLRAPGGAEVPLTSVVDFGDALGFARIQREDGKREVAVTAEIDMRTTRPGQIQEALLRDGLVDIAARYGLGYEFAGRAEDQRETLADMLLGTVLGLTFIYIVLSWVFSSYLRPFVVMSVIPLGFVGAALGHWVWGFDLTILSIFAILGLSGIVINDSIVLVTTIDERLAGEPRLAAVVNGACDRLRAVILTSATTIGGLLPLLFETSLQAQFLIPMALTLVFGLAVTTFVVLLLVPALIMIQGDLGDLWRTWRAPRGALSGA